MRELPNERKFWSEYENIALNLTELPYPGKDHEWNDKVRTDRAKQYMFCTQDALDKEIASQHPCDSSKENKESMEAHEKLKSYVKENRLYYAVFHTYLSEFKSGVRCTFAVGVSPSTGNLVGLVSMHSIHDTGDSDEKNRTRVTLKTKVRCPRSSVRSDSKRSPMDPLLTKNEYVLEKKVMLWGEAMQSFHLKELYLAKCIDGKEETVHDITFLKTYQPRRGLRAANQQRSNLLKSVLQP